VWPGRAASASSEASICAGVPSNRRPQPPENSVSPQNSSGAPSTSAAKIGDVPRRVAGHVDDAKVHAQHAAGVSPPASGVKGSGMRSRAGPYTAAPVASRSGHAAGVIAVVVRD
jgi:hypothetical protein